MPSIIISNGELADRVSILAIKLCRISGTERREEVQRQLNVLVPVMMQTGIQPTGAHYLALKHVNEKLWDIEEALRVREGAKLFDERFIELARSVYRVNDKRYSIKRTIDEVTGCTMSEEKELPDYE